MAKETMLKNLRILLMALAVTVFAFGTMPAHAEAVDCYPAGHATIATYWLSKSNLTVNFQVEWNCHSWGTHVFSLDYGDGNGDYYTCWSNCTSGIFKKTHTYSAAGTYLTIPQTDVADATVDMQYVTVP